MIYIGTMLLSMLIITFIKYFRISKKWKEAVYFWGFIPLILIGALRAYVGIDYTTYSLDQIPAVLAGSQTVKFELLDKLVVYIGYYLANQQHYFYIFAIFHIILMWFLYKYIVQQSSNVECVFSSNHCFFYFFFIRNTPINSYSDCFLCVEVY